MFWKPLGQPPQANRIILAKQSPVDTDVEFLRFNLLASGLNTAMGGNALHLCELAAIFAVQRRVCLRMKTPSYFTNLLREQGYSDNAIEEICRWYVCSTTKDSTGKLPRNFKN